MIRIGPGESVGLEVHDQFVRFESGTARLDLGRSRDEMTTSRTLGPGWAGIILAGVWHDLMNVGEDDVQPSSLYAPTEHPADTVHEPGRADPHD